MTAYPQKSKNDISLFSDNIDKLALYIDFLDDIFTLKSGSYAFVLLCESYCLIAFNVGGNRESRSYLTVYLDYYSTVLSTHLASSKLGHFASFASISP